MLSSKKRRGLIDLYSPQLIWDVSAILVALFSLLNLVEVFNTQQLFFLLNGRVLIQLLFLLLYFFKFVYSIFILRKVDKFLTISLFISIYILSINLLNFESQITNLKSLLSTTVWPILFVGLILSSVVDKKVDFTFGVIIFFFVGIIFLIFNIIGFLTNKLNSALSINSLYYFSFSTLFLFVFKNKYLYLLAILMGIIISIVFGKLSFPLSILVGGIICLFAYIETKNGKIFSFILDALIVLVIVIFVVSMVLIFTKNAFFQDLNDFLNGRFYIHVTVYQKFFESDLIHIVFGHGYDSVANTIGISAHSDYLEILYDYGLVGLGILVSLLTVLYFKISKIESLFNRCLSFGFLAFFLVLLISTHILFILKYSLMLFLLLATTLVDKTTTVKKKKERPKICWVLPANLPSPSVLGGAIETLLQMIIDENERTNRYDFVVISKFNSSAFIKSKNYKHTIFYYQKNTLLNRIYDFIYRILYKASFYVIPRHYSIINFYKKVRVIENPDICIIDGNNSQLSSLEGDEYFILYLHILPLMMEKQNGTKLISSTTQTWIISEYVKNNMLNYTKTKDVKKLRVLNNAINRDNFVFNEKEREIIRKQYKFSKKDFVVLFCGRITEDKGILDLVNAVLHLNNNFKLIIVGSPNFADKETDPFYNELITKTKSSENIFWTGYIKNNDLYKYYSAADLLCSPSKCHEAACLVNIEAMANSLAILTSRDGGIPEYVGDCAYYIDENDRIASIKYLIEKASKSNIERINHVKKGLAYSEKFSIKNYSNNFDELINEIIATKETGYDN